MPNDCFGAAIGDVIPFAATGAESVAGHQRAAGGELASSRSCVRSSTTTCGAFGGVSIIDPHYTSPYGAQINVGIQQEIKPGLVLNVDYVMNRGVHFGMLVDRNRVGAANSLRPGDGSGGDECHGFCRVQWVRSGTNSANVDCAIAAGAIIVDFADAGVGAGSGVGWLRLRRNQPEFPPDERHRAEWARLAIRVSSCNSPASWVPGVHSAMPATNVTYALSSFKTSSLGSGLSGPSRDQR